MLYVAMRVPILPFLFVVTSTYYFTRVTFTLPAAKVLLGMMSVLTSRLVALL
jgi:hypothetical protein